MYIKGNKPKAAHCNGNEMKLQWSCVRICCCIGAACESVLPMKCYKRGLWLRFCSLFTIKVDFISPDKLTILCCSHHAHEKWYALLKNYLLAKHFSHNLWSIKNEKIMLPMAVTFLSFVRLFFLSLPLSLFILFNFNPVKPAMKSHFPHSHHEKVQHESEWNIH